MSPAVDKPKLDGRYPFVYRDRDTWGRVGISVSQGTDYVRVDMLMENKPGGAWRVVEMMPEEAEQFGLRLLERAATLRAALKDPSHDR